MKEETKIVVLKSTNPGEYPDLEIECKVIANDQIGVYLSQIPDDKKFYAHKEGIVTARQGYEGEKVKTSLKTIINGREYILSEEMNSVKAREINGEIQNDIIVTNISSTSNEQYIVKFDKFMKTYTLVENPSNQEPTFIPVLDTRLLTQIDENIIIMTSWGEPAVCLAGSFIVTYDADTNDYNTLEQGAFESTYVREDNSRIKR